MAATNAQVQAFVDHRIRPDCELARTLCLIFAQDIASIDDVYAALNVQSPTWADSATQAPHVMTASDVLAVNAFLHDIRDAIVNNGQWAVVQKCCLNQVKG